MRLLELSEHLSHLKGLVKTEISRPHPRISNLLSLGWDLRILTSNKLPGDARKQVPKWFQETVL